jgi:hypothetical protein
MTRDTVAVETPAAFATVLMVTRRDPDPDRDRVADPDSASATTAHLLTNGWAVENVYSIAVVL